MSALAQLLAFLASSPSAASPAPHIRSVHLPTSKLHTEPVSCIYYTSRYFITGTDIVRALVFRFRVLNIPIASMKKFEEGIFSDLRNLKVGIGCRLEEPRSPFLVQLHELGCIRTQKKQKVFFWECVNHEYLFQEALGREKKRATGVAHDGLSMLDDEWRSMSALWESLAPLKVTVHHLSMPHADSAWSTTTVNPNALQSPLLSTSQLKAAPLARVAARSLLLDHGRSRASSSASSGNNVYSSPSTPMLRPSTPAAAPRSLPLSMYHLLNQSTGMPTPDALFMNNPFAQQPTGSPSPVKQASFWNDETIAAVTYEVLRNSPELFSTVCSTNESDPIVEYSNWLASENNSPSDNELSGDHHSSVFSALSLIEEADTASLLENSTDATLLASLGQDLAATELLFAQMIQPEVRKRARSNTGCSASSTHSSKSSKRFQPYPLPRSLML